MFFKNIGLIFFRTSSTRARGINSFLNIYYQMNVFRMKLSTSSLLQPLNQQYDWNRAVSEAEKIVGYPTSFLSLRWLLSDEIANVALHLRKLVGTNHPLLKTAKNLMDSHRNNLQAWGLIVLLISKAAGHTLDNPENAKTSGVLQSQRVIAEVPEMIQMSYTFHKTLINVKETEARNGSTEMKDVHFDNKIVLLCGDYLLSSVLLRIAALKNQDIVTLIQSTVRDQAASEFCFRRDKQNNPIPKTSQDIISDWFEMNVLKYGNLLGKSCQGTLLLAAHTPRIQEEGYEFGKNLALAWQACLELEPFNSSSYIPGSQFSLTSAPVMFHLERDPSLFEEIDKGLGSINDVDYAKVHQTVMNGPGVDLTKELQKHYSKKALQALHEFPDSDARAALSNIILAIGEL